MNEAIALARSMQGRVWPNPAVGCAIVRDGQIVGRGRTQFGGRPHAERVALEDAGDRTDGAALYVTLEPCCHWGKTPPCADAIIRAGIREVHASIQDPDPRVNGGGFRKLREAGLQVDVGLAADEAREIMAGFFHLVATGRPLIQIGSSDCRLTGIPEGTDALLRSNGNQIEVLTRTREDRVKTDHLDGAFSGENLLEILGDLGLTSIHIEEDDALAQRLSKFQHR